ncbi:MAG: hypothetical protein ABW098_17045 [Candidatus Thiodiazotropha sp.]
MSRLNVTNDEQTITLSIDNMSQPMVHRQALEVTFQLGKMWGDMSLRGSTEMTLQVGEIHGAKVSRRELAEGVLALTHATYEVGKMVLEKGWNDPSNQQLLHFMLEGAESIIQSESLRDVADDMLKDLYSAMETS